MRIKFGEKRKRIYPFKVQTLLRNPELLRQEYIINKKTRKQLCNEYKITMSLLKDLILCLLPPEDKSNKRGRFIKQELSTSVSELKQLYLIEKLSIRKIANQVKSTPWIIAQALKENSIFKKKTKPAKFSFNKLYKWSQEVKKRDYYICKECHVKKDLGIVLEAHHIIPKSISPLLAYSLDNGITLCHPCHKKIQSKEVNFINRYQESNRRYEIYKWNSLGTSYPEEEPEEFKNEHIS